MRPGVDPLRVARVEDNPKGIQVAPHNFAFHSVLFHVRIALYSANDINRLLPRLPKFIQIRFSDFVQEKPLPGNRYKIQDARYQMPVGAKL
jgi:hypothetical protein